MEYLILSLLLLFNLFVLIKTYINSQKLRYKNKVLDSTIFFLFASGKIDKYDLQIARCQALDDLEIEKSERKRK